MAYRIKLNNIDWYRAAPTYLDPQLPLVSATDSGPRVPVIRVFGAAETGERVCAHIHGALPYLYVDFPGRYDSVGMQFNAEKAQAIVRRLRRSIDSAMNSSLRRNRKASDKRKPEQYVASVVLVKGVPFYGYHVGWKLYCKIYLYNPRHMVHLAKLLSVGAIMNYTFRPYEAHIQYILQFMIDYNLYGCGYVDCEKSAVRFRKNTEAEIEDMGDLDIPPERILPEDAFLKQSFCTYEVDIQVHDIINRRRISERAQHHDFEERNNSSQADVKLVHSLDELWQRHGRHHFGNNKTSESQPWSASSASRELHLEWIQEEEYRELINEIIQREAEDRPNRTHEDLLRRLPYDTMIPTAFDSVDYLHWYATSMQKTGSMVQSQSESLEEMDEDDINEGAIRELEEIPDEFFARGDDQISDTASDILESEDQESEEDNSDDSVDQKLHEAPLTIQMGQHSVHESQNSDSDPKLSPLYENQNKSELATLSGRSANGINVSKFEEKRIPAFPNPLNEINGVQANTLGRKRRNEDIVEGTVKVYANTAEFAGSLEKELDHRKVRRGQEPEPISTASEKSLSNAIPEMVIANGGDGVITNGDKRLQKAGSFDVHQPSSFESGGELSVNRSHLDSQSSENYRTIGNIHRAFVLQPDTSILYYAPRPPTVAEALESLSEAGADKVIYKDAFYSNEEDVPEHVREYGGMEFRLRSDKCADLPEFNPQGEPVITNCPIDVSPASVNTTWQLSEKPPSRSEVLEWAKKQNKDEQNTKVRAKRRTAANASKLSQIEGPTQRSKHGFKYSQRQKLASAVLKSADMSIMSLEIHVNTRGTLVPDPAQDAVVYVFWCLQSAAGGECALGILVVDDEGEDELMLQRRYPDADIRSESSELDVITTLVDIVRDLDPDILTGYEVHSSSWGFLIERARHCFEMDLCDDLSRVKSQSQGRFGKDVDKWGYSKAAAIRVTGRHFVNIWRVMRGELNLLGYKMENVVYHLLNRRIPHYSYRDLTHWCESGDGVLSARLLRYFMLRIRLNLELLEKQEFVIRISEQARLIGVDFYTIFSRGSQIKVESLMFRIAKPESYMLTSPSKKQVAQQNAIECKPLIMEPQSRFYTSPVVVLDFQSLYPSVMIAYNYCYSTCLGRVVPWRTGNKLGVVEYQRPRGLLQVWKDQISVAPNGLMYVKPEFRKSLLAKMLSEILDTRVMVKNRMKQDKDDKSLQQKLNSWQLALKLIANVTYGYTSASFSGRMPCSEIADSIVQTGRETLEQAIALIHSTERWGAEVVYGDTDSLFIHLKGRTKAEAFDIGEEIANAVTAQNPKPIKLKFEKVYHPCVLMAMKRYVGYKYEHRGQAEPEFDAKGIETVRRDGTPAMQKMVEAALRTLFRTSDLSQVKDYCQRQWTKIMREKVSIQDFCFGKEVKLGTYVEGAPPPPGARLAARKMEKDPRNEPQYGERYPFVVVAGKPGQSITDRSVEVEWLLYSDQLRLDSDYYIRKKLIPPLERIFNLVGANVRQWYDEMPKYHGLRRVIRQRETETEDEARLATLEVFMDKDSSLCPICGSVVEMADAVCDDCLTNRDVSYYEVKRRLADLEERNHDLNSICRSCSGLSWLEDIACDSQDCPVYYSRVREASKARYEEEMAGPLLEVLDSREEERHPEMRIFARNVRGKVGKGDIGGTESDNSESSDSAVASVRDYYEESPGTDLDW